MALDYPITRSFPGKWFSLAAYIGAFIVLVFLTTVNVALTGYDTITVFQSDYNVTQTHWYQHYIPSLVPKAGTLCDSRVFNLGDTFTTNYTLFRYTVSSVVNANAGDSGISYKGRTLEHCDITSLYVHGDVNAFTLDYTAVVTCRSEAYEFSARTDFSLSSLAGKYNQLLGVERSLKNREEGVFNKTRDSRGVVLDAVASLSSRDVAARIFTLAQATNGSALSVISLRADFPFCPAALGPVAGCAVRVPQFNISSSFVSYSNLTFQQYFANEPLTDSNQPVITNTTYGVLANVIQTMYASVRVDLGNPSKNNFLLNPAAVPATIAATFPAIPGVYDTSDEYANLVGTSVNPDFNITGLLPLTTTGAAQLDVVYLCRFQQRKAPAQAFIAVLVATLSMFGSGWAAFLVLAAKIVKKRNGGANRCGEHTTELSHEKVAFIDR
ncbi:hypothetical protein B0H15DRAFT_920975 [Mycena belliarum]|uniref:Transmembrane protein n=1 Tax=Mycena belliarum TaxID=1033014 RepID=A0AAD6XSK5_9AGAR|nr:hypothetical protein B0H15DRAFT_920975 [Mycena belliae]